MITSWILVGLAAAAFLAPPLAALSLFGAVAEKRVSISFTSNSVALELEGKKSVTSRNQELQKEAKDNFIKKPCT